MFIVIAIVIVIVIDMIMYIVVMQYLFYPLSQCDRTQALASFFTQIITGPTKLGWVGSGCSVATEPTAEISSFYNITQVCM